MPNKKILQINGIIIQINDDFDYVDENSSPVENETFKNWCRRVLKKDSNTISVFLPTVVAPNKRIKTIQKDCTNLSLLNPVNSNYSLKLTPKDIFSISEIISHTPESINTEYAVSAPDRSIYIENYGVWCWSIMMRIIHLQEYCAWLVGKFESIRPLVKTSTALSAMESAIDFMIEEIDDSLVDENGNESGVLSPEYKVDIINWLNGEFWDLFNELESEADEDIHIIELISESTASIFIEAIKKSTTTIKTLANIIYEE